MDCPVCGVAVAEDTATCSNCDADLSASTPSQSPGSDPVPDWDQTTVPNQGGPGAQLRPGASFGERYIIIDHLGTGGMGVVYKARDRELNRVVALKLLRLGEERDEGRAVRRFRRELGLAQQVSHPNVCRVHDLGEAGGVRYLSMEYFEGHTLAHLIREVGCLSVPQTLRFGAQICAGLEAIHAQGIVHRDLKPSNIGINVEGRALVMDFGIARRPADFELTAPGVVVGSMAYMTPEQSQGKPIDPRVDIYGLGLVLFEMLTGRRPPADGDSRPLALRGADFRCPPPSRLQPEVPPELDTLVERCLRWEKAERPTEVGEVRRGLEESERRRTRDGVRRKPPARWLQRLAMTSVVAAAALAVAVILPRSPRPTPPPERVAVLPLQLPSDSPEESLLELLFADAMTALLQTTAGLSVASFETTSSLKRLPPPESAQALDVDWLLRVDLTELGHDLTVTVELLDGRGVSRWEQKRSGSSERPLALLEVLESPELRGLLEAGEPIVWRDIHSLRTGNLDAYRLYVEAKVLLGDWSGERPWQQAQDLCRRAQLLDPNFAAPYATQALLMIRDFARDPSQEAIPIAAASVATQAMDHSRALPEAWLALAAVRVVRGDPAAATDLERLDELAPGHDWAWRFMGDRYAEAGEPDRAEAAYRRAIELRSDWRNHQRLGLFFFSRNQLPAAREPLEAAAKMTLEPEVIVPLGYSYLMGGDLSEARSWFEELDPKPTYELGLVAYYQGRYDDALSRWQGLVDATPSPTAFDLASVADALSALGRQAEADSYYQRAIQVHLPQPEAALNRDDRANLALAWAATGSCPEAEATMSDLLERNRDNPSITYYGALTAARCGREEKAADLALIAFAAGNRVGLQFDPQMKSVRDLPRVREVLELATSPAELRP